MIGDKDSCGCDGKELDVTHGQFGAGKFALGIFKCIDVLRDTLLQIISNGILVRLTGWRSPQLSPRWLRSVVAVTEL